MTEQELTAIEERATAATMGPWDGTKNSGVVSKHTRDHVFETGCGCCTDKALSAEDAAFIAAARVDVPALIAEVRRLRAEREVTIKHYWATPTTTADLDLIAKLKDALTLATQRAEAAEADARSAWVEYAGEKETSAQRLCYLRQSEDMVDALTAERDALRKDAALLDALQAEHERNDPVAALVVKVKHDRNGSDWANVMGDIRAALADALAVQP